MNTYALSVIAILALVVVYEAHAIVTAAEIKPEPELTQPFDGMAQPIVSEPSVLVVSEGECEVRKAFDTRWIYFTVCRDAYVSMVRDGVEINETSYARAKP